MSCKKIYSERLLRNARIIFKRGDSLKWFAREMGVSHTGLCRKLKVKAEEKTKCAYLSRDV